MRSLAGEEVTCTVGGGAFVMGGAKPMLGDMPGFASFQLGEGAPAAVLGMDFLGGRDSFVVCPKDLLLLLGPARGPTPVPTPRWD